MQDSDRLIERHAAEAKSGPDSMPVLCFCDATILRELIELFQGNHTKAA